MYDDKCRKCELWRGVKSVCVPGRGNLQAEVLFVGQAPGEEEDEQGTCFVGLSGQLLEAACYDARLDNYRLENVARCFPPYNRSPNADEVKACVDYLWIAIDNMPNLKIIVPLGAVAARVFKVKGPITKISGTPHLWERDGRKYTVIPVFHPSYVLRRPEMKDKFQQLISAIPTNLTGVDPGFVKLVKGADSVETIRAFTDIKWPTAFDLETTGLEPEAGAILSVSFYTGRGRRKPVSCLLDTPEAIRALADFYGSATPKIVHNVRFEYAWGERHLGTRLRNVVADTMILSFRENSNRPVNLNVLSATHVPEVTGFKIDSMTALMDGEEWWDMDETVRGTRNAIDSYATQKAQVKLAKALGKRVMEIHRTVDIPIAIAYHNMQRNGMTVDTRRLLELSEDSKVRQKLAVKRARKVGITCNMGSTKQLEANFKELKLDTGQYGKMDSNGKRQMSTSEDALLDLKESFPHTAKWTDPVLDYRHEVKFRGTYVKGVAQYVYHKDKEGRGNLRGDLFWPGTTSWRPRCRKPNILNFPRGPFRSVIVSRFPNGWIVKADYGQIELVSLASLSRDSQMIHIYENGLDIHANTAKALKVPRPIAKNINFGVVYGIGPKTFRSTLRKGGTIVNVEQAEEWIKGWMATYPTAAWYMEELRKKVRKFRRISTPAHEIYRIFEVTGDRYKDRKQELEGANHPIQGGAAMVTNMAGYFFDRDLDKTQGLLVNLVYDELVAEAVDGHELEVAELMKGSMLTAVKEAEWLDLPVEVDVEIGRNWGELKSVG